MHFLQRIGKVDDYDLKSRTMGKYLLEVGALEWCLLAMPPSLVAAAAIWLSRLILGNDKWVRDACSLTLITFITLFDSSQPILPITRHMRVYSRPSFRTIHSFLPWLMAEISSHASYHLHGHGKPTVNI
jgi:hypothetical protein